MGLDNPLHILILALIVALVFGARRLPEIGRSLGEGMRGLRDSLTGDPARAAELPQAAASLLTDPPVQAPVGAAG